MHYCTFVFTKEEPTSEKLSKIMNIVGHDGYAIGGRYIGYFDTPNDIAKVSQAALFIDGEPGCYGFVIVDPEWENLVTHIKREFVNPEYDTLNYLCKDHEYVISRWLLPNPGFRSAFLKAVSDYKDGWVTVVDLHN